MKASTTAHPVIRCVGAQDLSVLCLQHRRHRLAAAPAGRHSDVVVVCLGTRAKQHATSPPHMGTRTSRSRKRSMTQGGEVMPQDPSIFAHCGATESPRTTHHRLIATERKTVCRSGCNQSDGSQPASSNCNDTQAHCHCKQPPPQRGVSRHIGRRARRRRALLHRIQLLQRRQL